MVLTTIEMFCGRTAQLLLMNEKYYLVEKVGTAQVVKAEYAVEDYCPGIYVKNDLHIFEDLVFFTLAYVEQPEEFERPKDATEQLEAAWWRTYGESLQMAIEEALND